MDEHGQATTDDPDRVRPPLRGKDERIIGQEKNVYIKFRVKKG